MWTALHYGVRSRKISIPLLKLLIKHGAQILARGPWGHTPFHMGNDSADVVRLFLDEKADMDNQNDNGNTPITLAVGYNATESVAHLLQAGADLRPINIWQQNILHQAALGASLGTLKCLLTADLEGIDPDFLNDLGQTPLQAFSESRVIHESDERVKEAERATFEALVEKAHAQWNKRGGASQSLDEEEVSASINV